MRFEGIYTPVITPYNSDLSIDRDGLAALIEHLVASGVNGIVLAGTTGEYYAQTAEERVELMAFARDRIKSRVPLIIGVGALRTEDAIEFAGHARSAGADAILVGSPYYAVPTELENAAHALAIDRAVNLPIMLYNYPGRTGAMMGPEFLNRVGRSRNVCAIKESSGDINHLHLLAREYPHIQLSCGMDDQALEFFAWGARSWVCGASNCLPREHIALYQACVVEGDFSKGRRIMMAMLPLMQALEQGGKFVQSIKYGCELAGLPAGPVRKPLRPMTKEAKRELATVIGTLKTTITAITGQAATQKVDNVIALNA